MPARRRFRLYVIRLRASVLRSRSFRKANPRYVAGKPCVYVGSTAKTPEQRFTVHMTDRVKGSGKVRKYGECLLKWAYQDLPIFYSREKAEEAEAKYADELRKRGWGVWQN
jgi:hypothetical protein